MMKAEATTFQKQIVAKWMTETFILQVSCRTGGILETQELFPKIFFDYQKVTRFYGTPLYHCYTLQYKDEVSTVGFLERMLILNCKP